MTTTNTRIWPWVGVLMLLGIFIFGFIQGWKHPSGWLPIILLVVVFAVAIYGQKVFRRLSAKPEKERQLSNELNHR